MIASASVRFPLLTLCAALGCLVVCANATADEAKTKPVAGKADVLRHVPKKFAVFLEARPWESAGARQGQMEMRLQVDGAEESPRWWTLNADAEIKIRGWWGRLDQLQHGDRVWVWFAIDQKKQPTGILMLADELSEQDIHGRLPTLKAVDVASRTITVQSPQGSERTLMLSDAYGVESTEGRFKFLPSDSGKAFTLHIGEAVCLQTAGNRVRLLGNSASLDSLRQTQRTFLRRQWTEHGLPGTVTFLHPLSGEMEVMLDHEAIRWGRSLKNGDAVTLNGSTRVDVRHVRPWRERTQLRLVTGTGLDQTALHIGDRVHVNVPEPPAELQQSEWPTDLDRHRDREARIEWLLSSIYCPCKVAGDRCTGMFYSLASCNVNACPMPNRIRDEIVPMMDQGMSDRDILKELKKSHGPQLLKPHLLP